MTRFNITYRNGAYYVSIPNYHGGDVVDASAFDALVAALGSIAGWRKVNISGEYEHGLRDIIRSITDCAAAALEASFGERHMNKGPLDFIDPGATDPEPAKGVTNGHLREWHDEIERLKADCGHWAANYAELQTTLQAHQQINKTPAVSSQHPVAQLNTADVPNPSTKSAIHKSNQS